MKRNNVNSTRLTLRCTLTKTTCKNLWVIKKITLFTGLYRLHLSIYRLYVSIYRRHACVITLVFRHSVIVQLVVQFKHMDQTFWSKVSNKFDKRKHTLIFVLCWFRIGCQDIKLCRQSQRQLKPNYGGK